MWYSFLILVSLTLAPGVDPQPPEAYLDRAAAEIGRIDTCDVFYTLELRDLLPVPRSRPGMSMTKEEGQKVREAFEERRKRFETDPAALLPESDPATLTGRAKVHLVRRREDFLAVIKREEAERAFSTDLSVSRTYAYGCLGPQTTRYKSKLDYQHPPAIVPANDRFPDATVGAAVSLERVDQENRFELSPQEVLNLIPPSRWVPTYFSQPSKGPPFHLAHRLELSPELKPGQVAVRSTVEDERLPQDHPSRLVVLEPAKSPLPVRIEMQLNRVKYVWRIDWHPFQGGDGSTVWFPRKARSEGYPLREGVNRGKLDRVTTLELDLSRSHVNQPVEDAELTFALPVGTHVTDARTGENYTVTAGGKGEVLLDQLFRDSQPSAPPSSTLVRRVLIVVVGSGVALAAVVAVFLRRRVKRGPVHRPSDGGPSPHRERLASEAGESGERTPLAAV